MTPEIKERLEYLRQELRAERISYGKINELVGLAEYIEADDVELLEAAGVPEFAEDLKGYKYIVCSWCGLNPPESKLSEYCSAKCRHEATGKGSK